MSDNFQSYSSYTPGPEEVYAAMPQLREEAPVYRTSSTNGAVSQSTERSHDTGHSGQINPYSGTDTWQATARTTTGRAVSEITPDTLVELDGMQAKVSFWVSEGRLSKGADGKYTEAAGTPEAPQEITGEIMAMDDGAMNVINAALDPLPQHALDQITAQGIGVALGRLTDESLTVKFAKASGIDLADSGERLNTIKAIYQDQADTALRTRAGIAQADTPAFWAWAKANHGGLLQEAIGKQLHSADVSGYTALAKQWQSRTAPQIAALQAAGIPTRKGSKGDECFLQGLWMSTTAAARSGLI